MKKEEDRENTEIRCGKNLTITIRDGDYTLREGVDYEVYHFHEILASSWLMLMAGVGKYENIFFRGHELMENSRRKDDEEMLREILSSAEEENDGSD